MMTAEALMDIYKNIRKEENVNGGLGIITNPQAQVGGILLVGLNPSGEGDDIHNYNSCESDFWDPKHEMIGGFDKNVDGYQFCHCLLAHKRYIIVYEWKYR